MSQPWEDYGPWNDFEEKPESVGTALITPEIGVPIPPEQVQADMATLAENERQMRLRGQLGYPEQEPRATVGTGFREELGERFGSYARGLSGLVPSAMKTAAIVLPRLTQGGPVTDPILPEFLRPALEVPELYQAGKSTQGFIEETFPQPEVSDLGHSVMEGFGQAGPMLGTGALVRAAGGGLGAATAAASTLGAVMEFDDAYERARQRGDSEDLAFAKSLGYATVAGLIENKLGAGRILRQLFPNAGAAVAKLTALGVSKRLLGNFVAGGVEEGSQRFAQNWIVDEKPSFEGVKEEALPGAIVETVLGLPGIGVTQRERTPDAVQRQTETVLRDVRQPEVAQEGPVQMPVPEGQPETAQARVGTPADVAAELGLTVETSFGMEGLTPEQQKAMESLSQRITMTDRRMPGESPTAGLTFTVPKDATREQIIKVFDKAREGYTPPATTQEAVGYFPRVSETVGMGEASLPPTVETVRQQRALDERNAVPPAPGEKTTPSRGVWFGGNNPKETSDMMQGRADAFLQGKTDEQAIVDLARAAAGDPAVQLDNQAANFAIKDLLVRIHAKIQSARSNPVYQQQGWAQIDRLAELSRRLGAEDARSLVSRQLAYRKIDWMMPLLTWRGIVQEKWRQLLNIPQGKTVEDALREVTPSPQQVSEEMEDEVEQNDAEKSAQFIVDKLATSQSDTLKWSKETIDGVRESVKWYILGDITDAEFQATMDTLQVNPNTARVLLGVSNREWAIREGYRQRKTAEQKARRENQAQMRKLRAQAYIAFKATGEAGRTADAIIDRFAKTQTDTQTWSEKTYNTVKETFNLYLNGDATADEFQATMDSVGVTRTQTQALLGVANREIQTRRFYEQIKERERISKLVRDTDKINTILKKIGAEGRINWSSLFLDDPTATQEEWRKYLFDAINRDPQFSTLSKEDRIELAKSLESAWQRQRINIFRQQFRNLIRLPEVTIDKIERELMPEIIRQANLGTLNDRAFVKAFANKLGLPDISGENARKLMELSQKAQSEPEGLRRNKVMEEMVRVLQSDSSISKLDLLRDVWYASVLMRVGTMLNVLAGSYATGASFAGLAALDRFVRLHPIQAMKIIGQFISGTLEGTVIADQIARKGAYHLLPDAEQRMTNLLTGKSGARFDNLEEYLRRGNPIGILAYTRRFMAALDYIGALGTRDSQVLYGALTRNDQESLDALDRKSDKAINQQAEQQARAEMGPNASRAEVLIRKREILEQKVSQEIKDNAVETARRAAQNADPRGIPGAIYRLSAKIPFLARAPLGLAFMRSAMNMVQNASDYTPVIGAQAALRGEIGARVAKDNPLRKSGVALDIPIEERRMMWMAQAASLGIGAIAAGLFLGDDDDKDGMEISGSWLGLSPKKRSQLMELGERPNSIRFGKNGPWISFKQMPFAPPLSMVGSMRDQQRFNAKEWNGESAMSKLISGWLSGLLYVRDISSLSGIAALFDMNAWNTQESPTKLTQKASKFASQSAGRFATGYIPSLLKEIDEFSDPTLYRPSKDEMAGYWIRNIPWARRTVGPGPALNQFGEPIQVTPPPIKSWAGFGKDNDLYNTLGALASRGIFLPEPGKTAKIVDDDAVYREMTDEEWYKFVKERGPMFKDHFTEGRLKWLREADERDVTKWLSDTSEKVSTQARTRLFPLTRIERLRREPVK